MMDHAKEPAGWADKVKQIEFFGEPAWELNSERLTCIVFPGHGGKVLSLKSRETGFELLFQNPRKDFKKAEPGSPFEEFEACGFDDAFPSIDAGFVTIGGREVAYPDHGEIWSAGFDCLADGEGLCLSYQSKILPYRYEKRLSLRGDTLHCSYRIENLGRDALPCIWACHCLVVYMPDMRLVYPAGTREIEAVLDSGHFGPAGTVHQFSHSPEPGAWDFTRVPGAETEGMEKYYVRGEVKEGKCGFIYPSAGMAADLKYDEKELPYLGFWITTGGYRGDKNCAFEPASGYYDSIGTAAANERLRVLQPGEVMAFDLEIRLYPWKPGWQMGEGRREIR